MEENRAFNCEDVFGENVFSIRTMKKYLPAKTFAAVAATLHKDCPMEPAVAEEVAEAMKTWAMERGATHFCHWFQPLTGGTAEKHDSFLTPDHEGGVIAHFSASDLIRGEPDASSFPSGGLRATFEARGYTAWDATSPVFLKMTAKGATVLCVPTVFCGYHGEALDKKAPLLRSMEALAGQIRRMAKLFRVEGDATPCVMLGVEQEYFLVDRKFYHARPDLIQAGRTLFGRTPARHQQLEDHYFGAIRPRVLAYMAEVDRELWKLGIPARTRHNEVSPGQYELAFVHEEQNLAIDHNMMAMEVLREAGRRHGFACLLHPKPFAGVNGSGKHNNWSIVGPDGKNWFSPGATPHENAKFLAILCCVLQALDEAAPVLRAITASAANDLRLGGNEAPPAIISVFLGNQLEDIIRQIAEGGGATHSKTAEALTIGVSTMPPLPRDATDRNRTSPIAFTGNKFELRMVASDQNCSTVNMVLNTATANAVDDFCSRMEAALAEGAEFNTALQDILQDMVQAHQHILFEGDGYTADWLKEAERRGLFNAATTPEALRALDTPEAHRLFEGFGVLSERELDARREVYKTTYEEIVRLEGRCACTMARTYIFPAAIAWRNQLAAVADAQPRTKNLLASVEQDAETLLARTEELEAAVAGAEISAIRPKLAALREVADSLEGVVPDHLWPFPDYAEMFFLM